MSVAQAPVIDRVAAHVNNPVNFRIIELQAVIVITPGPAFEFENTPVGGIVSGSGSSHNLEHKANFLHYR